jgi:hypothetical protein
VTEPAQIESNETDNKVTAMGRDQDGPVDPLGSSSKRYSEDPDVKQERATVELVAPDDAIWFGM